MEHIPVPSIFTKPQKRQSPEKSGLCRIKMAEAMGFELLYKVQPNTSLCAAIVALTCDVVNINESGLCANKLLPEPVVTPKLAKVQLVAH